MKLPWIISASLLALSVHCNQYNDDASAYSEPDDGSYYNKYTVCQNSVVMVDEMSIVCDSPGAYYYGSNKYRNSASCQSGDKAIVDVVFEILDDLNGKDPYLTVSVKGYGTVSSVTVLSSQSFCSNVQSVYGTSCPAVGTYKLHKQFYWGSQSDNYEYSFKPKVTVGIASGSGYRQYDLGGANTNQCQGDVFYSWTTGVRKSMANTVSTFFLTFGIMIASLCAIIGAGWLIMRRANPNMKEVIVEDEIDADYHKISMMGQNKSVVDF